MSGIAERILKEIGEPDLLRKLSGLSPSDLNSVLLEMFRLQCKGLSPAKLLKNYRSNRFALPSAINPAVFHMFEAQLLKEAEEQGIKGLLLAPVSPLGSCSAFGCVNQNNVVSASRGIEVLSDPTNMLALIIADQLKSGAIDNRVPVHFCTTVRVARGQAVNGPRSFPHFGIFSIVSSGKDTGSYTCEKEMMVRQLSFYKGFFGKRYSAKLSAVLRKRGGYTDTDGFFTRMTELIKTELPDVSIMLDEEHTENAYYKGINYKIFIHIGEEAIEIGDGGFVDWTQRLTGSKKERCLISGIGIDRLLMI